MEILQLTVHLVPVLALDGGNLPPELANPQLLDHLRLMAPAAIGGRLVVVNTSLELDNLARTATASFSSNV